MTQLKLQFRLELSLKDLWKSKKEFNYNLENIFEKKGGVIKTTPFGNTILKDLAIQILKTKI